MSHELRTPLNAIIGFSEIMEHDPTVTSGHRNHLKIIRNSGAHLRGLINDILDVSKIEADLIAINKKSFDLHHTLTVIEEIIRSKSGAKRLPCTVSRTSDVPRYIRTDEQRLRQVPLKAPQVIGLAPGQPAYRLLVVDDNLANRILLSKLLRIVGFEVYEAVDGRDGIAQYEKWQPALIWMGMRMPVMDGYDATRAIREAEINNQKSKIPIIAVTTHALKEERKPILAAGCDDVIRKPFQEAEIFEAMAKYLGVRYIYEETEGLEAKGLGEAPRGTLTSEALAELPDDLLVELKQAIIDLDMDLIQEVTKRIRMLNEPVADELDNLAVNFQYDRLLFLIQPGEV